MPKTTSRLPAQPLTAGQYASEMRLIAGHIMSTGGDMPKRYNIGQRAGSVACAPLMCLPCCVWSLLWRCLACPIQCCVHGVSYACSDNGCTAITDACVAGWFDAFTESRKLARLSECVDFSSAKVDDVQSLLKAIDEVAALFPTEAQYLRTHYALVKNVVDPMIGRDVLPSNAVVSLAHVRDWVVLTWASGSTARPLSG
jgi:hypothetical protein